ncbi:zinc finger 300 isoform X1 [Pelobates cultripes]|uniref:Zinc finger 300 isoform X1 n=1 Tax=Pelobates cultripes TaxID=61616 RepID=A0AAD1SY28_PELCU|nr:zinc finger 300 isoform X1 [Pelobates cultripes]
MIEMTKDTKQMTERILNHALGIIFLLTGEEYVVVKKSSPHSIHLLTGEVPIKCGDISIYFSMEEWDYIEGHKDIYQDVMIKGRQVSDASRSPKRRSTGTHDENVDPVFISEVPKNDKLNRDSEQVEVSVNTGAGDLTSDIVHSGEINEAPVVKSNPETKEKQMDGDICTGCSLVEDSSTNKDMFTKSQTEALSSDTTVEGDTISSCKITRELHTAHSSMDETVESENCTSHGLKQESRTQTCALAQTVEQDSVTSHKFVDESWKMSSSLAHTVANTSRSHDFQRGSWTVPCTSDWSAGGGNEASHGCKEETQVVDCSLPCTVEGDTTTSHAFQGSSSWTVPCLWDRTADVDNSMSHSYQGVSREHSPNESGSYESGNIISLPLSEHNMHLLNERFVDGTIQNIHIKEEKSQDHEPTCTDPKLKNCDKCGELFNSANSLLLHQRTHLGGDTCEKQLPTSSNFFLHQKMSCTCPVCGKWFSKRAHLLIHQRTHTGEKPYSCAQCGKCFSKRSHVVMHYRTHTGEKPYVCTVCEKSFAKRTNLVTHLRIHTREKPFMCPVCGKYFTRRSNMVTHQRTHTGEKPYSCPECGKCFSQRSHMVTHHKTHSGEKPYICSVCGKGFAKRSYLEVHQRTHRTEKVNMFNSVEF